MGPQTLPTSGTHGVCPVLLPSLLPHGLPQPLTQATSFTLGGKFVGDWKAASPLGGPSPVPCALRSQLGVCRRLDSRPRSLRDGSAPAASPPRALPQTTTGPLHMLLPLLQVEIRGHRPNVHSSHLTKKPTLSLNLDGCPEKWALALQPLIPTVMRDAQVCCASPPASPDPGAQHDCLPCPLGQPLCARCMQ